MVAIEIQRNRRRDRALLVTGETGGPPGGPDFRCFGTARILGTQCDVCTRLPVVVLAWGWWIGRIFPMGRGHATCRCGSRTTAFHPVAQFRSFTQTAREWSGETP